MTNNQAIPQPEQGLTLTDEDALVAQIRVEWEAIEAKRPRGNFDASLDPIFANRHIVPAQQQRLIDVIQTLHETVMSYHSEMGILLRALLTTRAQLAASQAALSETEALINEWRMEAICTVSLATQRAYGAAAMQVDCALRLEKALAKAQAQGSGQGGEAEARDADLRADIESLANACRERAGDEQTPFSHAIMLGTFANELEQALAKAQEVQK